MRAVAALLGLAVLAACDEPELPPAPQAPVLFERVSSDAVAHGERLSAVLGCSGCHGADLTGEDWSEDGFGKLWTANLTRAVRAYSDEELVAVITSGARPDRELWEMPSHLFTQLHRDDMAALIAFLRSRPPVGKSHPPPVFEEGARREIAAGTFTSSHAQTKAKGGLWPPEAGPGHALGRYIVRATCAECHGLDLRGGQPHPAATPRPDLRMAAAYDRADFRRLLKTGIAAGGREVSLMSEVARGRYAHLTDAEIDAVHLYLKRVAETAP